MRSVLNQNCTPWVAPEDTMYPITAEELEYASGIFHRSKSEYRGSVCKSGALPGILAGKSNCKILQMSPTSPLDCRAIGLGRTSDDYDMVVEFVKSMAMANFVPAVYQLQPAVDDWRSSVVVR